MLRVNLGFQRLLPLEKQIEERKPNRFFEDFYSTKKNEETWNNSKKKKKKETWRCGLMVR